MKFAAANRRQESLDLSFVAIASDDGTDQRRDQQNICCVEIATRDFLMRDAEGHVIEAGAAQARIHHRCEDAEIAQLAYQLRRQVGVAIAIQVMRFELAPGKITERRLQELLFRGQAEIHRDT